MHELEGDVEARLKTWRRVREYAVPPSMIERATARRVVGDWVGACAAARVDVEVDIRAVGRTHGTEVAQALRADLRHLAPDLLRWHMPRVAPDGRLRSGLTIALARYRERHPGGAHLVVRTPPQWAAGSQRIVVAWWAGGVDRHPHPYPDARFRLDLHRHLWDARRSGELGERVGSECLRGESHEAHVDPRMPSDWAVHRWAAEAAILRLADGVEDGDVQVRVGPRQHVILLPEYSGTSRTPDLAEISVQPVRLPGKRARRGRTARAHVAVLPDAATWVLPDLQLLRSGLLAADALHPLVAEGLGVAGPRNNGGSVRRGERVVECRGAMHRVVVAGGVLTAPDHSAEEIRREELLAAMTGLPLPCLQVIDQLHRAPSELAEIRAQLDHGDVGAAVAFVETMLGQQARLRTGDLRDELAAAAADRVLYGIYRAGLRPLLLDFRSLAPQTEAWERDFRASQVARATRGRHRDRASRRRLAATHR